MFNGKITVVNPETQARVTFTLKNERVWRREKDGRRRYSYGQRVLEVTEGSETTRLARFVGPLDLVGIEGIGRRGLHLIDIAMEPEHYMGLHGLEYYASRTCRRCGAALTVPSSIKRGIGPECIERLGMKEEAERLAELTGAELFGEVRMRLERGEESLALLAAGHIMAEGHRCAALDHIRAFARAKRAGRFGRVAQASAPGALAA